MVKMADGRLLCFVLVGFFFGTDSFAEDINTNIWAVKIRGSLQEAKQLALKHGFAYDRHVRLPITFSLPLIKIQFSHRLCFAVTNVL